MNNIERLILTPEYLESQGLSVDFPERFWRKVDKTISANGCWIWIAGKQGDGYGVIKGRKSCILAHRASWIINRGPIPYGMQILHNCFPEPDNKLCINPIHLRIGTDPENRQDAKRKHQYCHGESHRKTKLTWEQVRLIRSMYVPNKVSAYTLGRMFNMTAHAIWGIVHFRTWKG